METAGSDSMSVLGIHEPEVKLERQVFHHVVFVANITDDVLLGLDLMEQHKFQLDLENRVKKIGQDESVMTNKKGYIARRCQFTSKIRNHC